MIPQSFTASKSPFIQFRMPQAPAEDLLSSAPPSTEGADAKQASEQKSYPAVNARFSLYKLPESRTSVSTGQGQTGHNEGAPNAEEDAASLERASSGQEGNTDYDPEDPYRLPFPLGEIVYESNTTDPVLKGLNTNPVFIDFVNSVQEALYNGSREDSGGAAFTRSFEHQYRDDNDTIRTKKYMFYGQSLRPEAASSQDSAFNSAIRSAAEYNLLIFTIQDVFHADEVFVRASALFLGSKVSMV